MPPESSPGSQGAPEAQEAVSVPEALRGDMGLYTVEGGDFIRQIKETAERGSVKEFQKTASEALAYMEGCKWGVDLEVFDLSNRSIEGTLLNMFTTVEGATKRPNYGQVYAALDETAAGIVRETSRYKKDNDAWKIQYVKQREQYWTSVQMSRGMFNQKAIRDAAISNTITEEKRLKEWGKKENINYLIGLSGYMDARILHDTAFVQRMQTCEVDMESAKMRDTYRQGFATPDKGHWVLEYQHDKKFGAAVSNVENVITAIAKGDIMVPGVEDSEDLYTDSFATVGNFAAWLEFVGEHAVIDGVKRFDVVYNAWKKSLYKETITKHAWKVEKDEKTGNWRYVFGNPPFSNDLLKNLFHNDKVRADEAGWQSVVKQRGQLKAIDWDEGRYILINGEGKWLRDDDGNIITEEFTQEDLFMNPPRYTDNINASHCGQMMSIGHVGRINDHYEARYTVGKWVHPTTGKEHENISLFDIAYKHKISRADDSFPWVNVAKRKKGEPSTELQGGSAGLVGLNNIRGHLVRTEQERAVPEPRELNLAFFQDPKIRMWKKLKKMTPGPLMESKKQRDGSVKWEPTNNIDKGIPRNPFAMWLAGVFRERSELTKNNKYTKGDRGHRSNTLQKKTITHLKKGKAGDGANTDADIISYALDEGRISPEEKDWIEKFIIQEEKKRKDRY